MKKISHYLICNLQVAHIPIIASVFFGIVGVGFALISQTQYALASLVIGFIISQFSFQMMNTFTDDEAVLAYGIELDVLGRFILAGLIPASLMIVVGELSVWGLIVGSIYALSVALRLAHFNSGVPDEESETQSTVILGLPISLAAVVVPLVFFLGYVVPLQFFQWIYGIILMALAVGYLYKIKLPRIPDQIETIVMGIMLVIVFITIWLGSIFTV